MKASKKQEKILAAIKEFSEERGYQPTVRDIRDHLGIKSTSTVQHHLYALRGKGLVDWEDGQARTVHLV